MPGFSGQGLGAFGKAGCYVGDSMSDERSMLNISSAFTCCVAREKK
jgi:hypothetical protein